MTRVPSGDRKFGKRSSFGPVAISGEHTPVAKKADSFGFAPRLRQNVENRQKTSSNQAVYVRSSGVINAAACSIRIQHPDTMQGAFKCLMVLSSSMRKSNYAVFVRLDRKCPTWLGKLKVKNAKWNHEKSNHRPNQFATCPATKPAGITASLPEFKNAAPASCPHFVMLPRAASRPPGNLR